jgi:hypothetical protein
VSDGEFKVDSENTFKGTLTGDLNEDSNYDWYAFYPYSKFINSPNLFSALEIYSIALLIYL